MNTKREVGGIGALLFFLLVLPACTSVHKPSGFLDDYSDLAKGEHFRQEYVVPGTDFTKYEKVKVEPVELKYFENPKQTFTQEELDRLALRFKTSLEKQFGKRYRVLGEGERADDQTLIVRPALTYVKTPRRLINVATFWLIGFAFSKGSAAFEAELIDGGSGRAIVQAAEKRKSGGGIKDIKSILVGGWLRFVNAEGAFKRWGKEFHELTLPPKVPN